MALHHSDYESEPSALLSPSGSDYDFEVILARVVDANGICWTCGQNHSFKPDFKVVETSIDNVSELFGERLLKV